MPRPWCPGAAFFSRRPPRLGCPGPAAPAPPPPATPATPVAMVCPHAGASRCRSESSPWPAPPCWRWAPPWRRVPRRSRAQHRRTRPAIGQASRSRWGFRIRPAAPATSWAGSCRTGCARSSGRPSSSKTRPAPPPPSARPLSRVPPRTAIRCCCRPARPSRVVRKDFPARNLREFAAYAQVNPGKVNNATNGQGGLGHLLGELVATGLGVQLTQVHYKGAVPAAMDLIGGIVDSNVQALTNAVPNVNAGQYRALAVLSAERQPLLPQVPTFKELGYPQIVGDAWYAVFAPAGTPKPVLDKLGAAIRKITGSARFGAAMRKVGNQAQTGTPEQLRELTLQQSRRWGDLIRQHGIEAE